MQVWNPFVQTKHVTMCKIAVRELLIYTHSIFLKLWVAQVHHIEHLYVITCNLKHVFVMIGSIFVFLEDLFTFW